MYRRMLRVSGYIKRVTGVSVPAASPLALGGRRSCAASSPRPSRERERSFSLRPERRGTPTRRRSQSSRTNTLNGGAVAVTVVPSSAVRSVPASRPARTGARPCASKSTHDVLLTHGVLFGYFVCTLYCRSFHLQPWGGNLL